MRSLALFKARSRFLSRAAAVFSAGILCSVKAATLDVNFDSDPSSLFEATGGNPGPLWSDADGNPATGGYLKITDAVGSQSAFLVFKDADNGKIVTGFTFTADVRIGNDFGNADHRGADGFSISFARSTDPFLSTLNTGQLAAGLPEAGTSTGLAISFDAWAGNSLPDGPDREGIIIRLDNRTIGGVDLPTRNGACADQTSLQTGPNDDSGTIAPLCWQPVSVTLGTDGKLTVSYKGKVILNGFQTGFVPSPGRLVFAGRTGGNNQIQHVDNLHLVTTVATAPIVSSVTGGLKTFSFQIFDNGADGIVDPATVVVKNGANTLTTTATKPDGSGTTTVTYSQATPFAANSTQNLTIDFKDSNGNAIPTVTRSFVVGNYNAIYSVGINFGASEPLQTGHIVDPTDNTVLAGLAPDDVAGIGGVAQAGWNNAVDLNNRVFSGTNGTLQGVMVFNKGNIETNTDTYVEWHSAGTWTTTSAGTVHTENNNNWAAGNDRILMTAYLDTGSATTTRILITNLPPVFGTNGYDLYVYALASVSTRGGGYRILTPGGTVLRNYLLGTSPASANPTVYTQDAGASHSDTGNYVKFSGLLARNIVIEATTDNGQGGSGTPRAPVEAVQLVSGGTAVTTPSIGDVFALASRAIFTITDVPGVAVDPSTITVKLDTGTTNIPITFSKDGNVTTVTYDIAADKKVLFASGSHTFNITVNGGANVAKTFTVASYNLVDSRWALPFDAGDSTKPGFRVRVHGYDSSSFLRGPGDLNQTVIVERALNNGFVDPSTGEPYADVLAGQGDEDAQGYRDLAGPVNIDAAGGQLGFFNSGLAAAPYNVADVPLPGIPAGGANYFEAEFVTYLKLPIGAYRFAVNSDDGFRASFGPGQDAVGNIVGQFNGGRGQGTPTFFDFAIGQDGVYPFRLSFWQGTGGQNVELYSHDPFTGADALIGDVIPGAIQAYRSAANARPSIRRALPVQDWIGAYANDDVVIEIADDPSSSIKQDASNVQLYINNTNQTSGVTVTKTGDVTKLVRKGSLTNLLYSGVNTVRVVRTVTEGGNPQTYTNQYNINVAPYYGAVPVAYAVPAEQMDKGVTGFKARVDQMDKTKDGNQGNGGRPSGNGGDGNRLPHPEQQLAGSIINTATGTRFPNLASAGANSDWTYSFDLFNFRSPLDGAAGVGMITQTAPAAPHPGANTDAVMPGLPGAGTSNGGNDNYVMEATTYLDLKAGVYVFGLNSDDGFLAMFGADPHDTLGTLVGFANIGRGNSGNLPGPVGTTPYLPTPQTSNGSTLFNVIVPQDGIYPLRLLYWQGGGGVNAEFYILNQSNGEVALVNDSSVSWSPLAYSGYTGPAKPWTRFSVSPTPWDNKIQQAGPDPLLIYARTPANIQSNDILNQEDSRRPFANTPIGGVVANGAAADVKLQLDGVDVTASADVTVTGTDKKIAYQPGKGANPLLASGSTHTASLVYAGGTNSWTFRVGPYVVVPDTNRLDFASVDAGDRGFQVRAAQAADNSGLANTVAARETQLAGSPVDTFSVKGPGPNGSYILTNGVINWSITRNKKSDGNPIGGSETGNFEAKGSMAGWPYGDIADQAFPGVVPQGANLQNFAEEIIGYLEFPTAGFYRFGANGDDGWRVQIGTSTNLTAANQNGVDVAQTNPNVLFSVDRGAGNQDIPFGFVIPTAGIYPMRVVYYQGGGGASFELFSYDNDVTGGKILINDPTNPKAIKSYFRLKTVSAPSLSFAVSGGNLTITYTAGATLQSTDTLANPSSATLWNDVGTSGTLTIPLPGPGQQLFYRVKQ